VKFFKVTALSMLIGVSVYAARAGDGDAVAPGAAPASGAADCAAEERSNMLPSAEDESSAFGPFGISASFAGGIRLGIGAGADPDDGAGVNAGGGIRQ